MYSSVRVLLCKSLPVILPIAGLLRVAQGMAQLWVGNVPIGHGEGQTLRELAAYGTVPMKALVRHPREGHEGFAVLSMASVELAEQALGIDGRWSSGRYMLVRP